MEPSERRRDRDIGKILDVIKQGRKGLGRTAIGSSSDKIEGKDYMSTPLEDTNIIEVAKLPAPRKLHERIKVSDKSKETVLKSRANIKEIITKPAKSNRLLVVVGPCSIHDTGEALEYAGQVSKWRDTYGDNLEIVMRSYLEKPRTTIGWKGLIVDPDLDKSHDMAKGLEVSRKLLSDITDMGVPVSSELVNTTTPQYIDDFVSWGAIGARTTESQQHRELASGVSFPVGFKNSTSGDVQVAADAIVSAQEPHSFTGIDSNGDFAKIASSGNQACHVILRGGTSGPNFDERSVKKTVGALETAGLVPSLMIDCSHGNSGKDYRKQKLVAHNVASQIESGNSNIAGIMIESNLTQGKQNFVYGETKKEDLARGQSITDSCAGLEDTEEMLSTLSGAVQARKSA